MVDIDTPQELREPPSDLSPWLVWHISKLLSGIQSVDKRVGVLDAKVNGAVAELTELRQDLNGEITRSQRADEDHNQRIMVIEEGSKVEVSDDSITFRWLVEKLGAPVVTGLVTAILVAAVVAWIVGGVP